ncbi:hypothetical protein NBM05_07370 [Rothia sp. AR01]|uniref:DUF4913 domain-containing protein n=1 Tax=Rothia santali TaxID=2949643 RepID=A0A9X2KIB4_9MICC|nr:hypothetical protein [Rothia santali]MCP3425830.1 hypothetical protein [Rothia santali]
MALDWSALKPVEEKEERDAAAGEAEWDDIAAQESAGDVGAFLDSSLDGADSSQPRFLGKRWREITDPVEKREAWGWLREWVDWFVLDYNLSTALVPPCWFKHRELVAELWAAANAEYKVWEEGAASVMPLTSWHNYLPGVYERLKNSSAQRCVSAKKHNPPPEYGTSREPGALQVDEALWADHLVEVIDMEDELEAGQWRMVIADEQGNVTSSEPVTVGAGAEPSPMFVRQPYLAFDGEGQPRATAAAVGENLTRSWWEYREHETDEWVLRMSSMRDISQTETEE